MLVWIVARLETGCGFRGLEGGVVHTARQEAPSAEKIYTYSVTLKEKPVGEGGLEGNFVCDTILDIG